MIPTLDSIDEPEPAPRVHIYALIENEGTPGGYKFYGVKYELGRRPVAVYDDSIDRLKNQLA